MIATPLLIGWWPCTENGEMEACFVHRYYVLIEDFLGIVAAIEFNPAVLDAGLDHLLTP